MGLHAPMCIALLLVLAGGLQADQIEMQNGDRYAGKVVSMTADKVVLQSDVLGRISLPRAKVANINLGAVVTPVLGPPAPRSTNQVKAPSLTSTNGNTEMTAMLRQLGTNSNFIEQVRKQFLADAGPDANHKFDEMLNGLMTGKMDISGIRAEAKSAADQIRELKKQGGDTGDLLDSYLAILDDFVKETAPAAPTPPSPTTNAPAAPK